MTGNKDKDKQSTLTSEQPFHFPLFTATVHLKSKHVPVKLTSLMFQSIPNIPYHHHSFQKGPHQLKSAHLIQRPSL